MKSVRISRINQTDPAEGNEGTAFAEGHLIRIRVTIAGAEKDQHHTFEWQADGRHPIRTPSQIGKATVEGDQLHYDFDWHVEGMSDQYEFLTRVFAWRGKECVSDTASAPVRLAVRKPTLSSDRAVAKMHGIGRMLGATLLDRLAEGSIPIAMKRSATSTGSPADETLWVQILATTRATSFQRFAESMGECLCKDRDMVLSGTRAYETLRDCARDFMKERCVLPADSDEAAAAAADAITRLGRSVALVPPSPTSDPNASFPNISSVTGRISQVPSNVEAFVECWDSNWRRLCLVELIWSYWHEEGMLVQSLKAISRRFQNRRLAGPRDPLANLEIDPLRPLTNVLWGYVGDEVHRLSVLRRAHEYEHHYGLAIEGAATAALRPADRRSRFLEYFHNLLNACAQFFVRDDDNTVHADGFPVLNAIRALHFLIAEGAHNQFGDLPETARYEMLIEQWIMARPEMRDFLRGRTMVPYPEPWMDTVDAMKSLQGWSDASVIYFHDLGVFGEQILLSVRHGAWATQTNPAVAVAWARFWRQELQGYMHAYRAVTGVDLSVDQVGMRAARERDLPPSVHLRRRLAAPGAF
ncbi:MAG: hypothetical protein IT457_11780 [Planctomycetes bacterium]|nr:hypothetical protein [Planctomycetota bacterium]